VLIIPHVQDCQFAAIQVATVHKKNRKLIVIVNESIYTNCPYLTMDLPIYDMAEHCEIWNPEDADKNVN
jgi:hypothetical protein